MLAEVMPLEWYVRAFLRPVACIEKLLQEAALWEADAWTQQEIVNNWREGASLIPQILAYWRKDATTRFGFTQVCVVDYSMPAMSGLRVLSELDGWPGARVLLTGRADEQLAVSAFNRGLIERFIPKQAPEVRLRLTDAIKTLFSVPSPRHEQIWRATLSREQHALLRSPVISKALEDLVSAHGWVEHVVIGAPFGVLALDDKSNASWLQLEPAGNLQELAEMARAHGCDAASVQYIQKGEQLIDLELQLALGNTRQPELRKAFAVGSEPDILHGALFSINESFGPTSASSYQRFAESLEERRLQD